MEIKFNKSLTMNQIFLMLWIVMIPIIIMTMVIGKFMTCVLLAAGVYAYVNKTLGKTVSVTPKPTTKPKTSVKKP